MATDAVVSDMHGIDSSYRLLRGLYALDANNKIWTEFGLDFDKSGFEEGQLDDATLFQRKFSHRHGM